MFSKHILSTLKDDKIKAVGVNDMEHIYLRFEKIMIYGMFS